MSKGLPAGWSRARIEELCDYGPRHPRDTPGDTLVSFVPMAAVSDSGGEIVEMETRTFDDVKKGYTHFADGDVIWAKITPCMENGKAAVARGLTSGLACGSTEFMVFRSRGAIEPQLLHRFLRQESYRRAARRTMKSGVGQARVPKEFVLGTELDLPPLNEQRRIVDKVDALFAHSRKAKESLDRIPALLEKLKKSILASAFRGDLTREWRTQNPVGSPGNPESATALLERIRVERRQRWEEAELAKMRAKGKEPANDKWKAKYKEPEPVDTTGLPELPEGWEWVHLEEVADVQLGQRRAPEYADDEVFPYIRAANITWRGLDLSDVMEMGFADPVGLSLKPGDVLLNEASGSRSEVGKPVLWSGEIDPCCFQATVLRVRCETSDITPQWLRLVFLRDALLGRFAGMAPGTGMVHLTSTRMRRWAIPVAPPDEQASLVEKVASALARLQPLAEAHAQFSRRVGRLDQAILAKAFRGELVPQDPNDEPASVLLERIRAERESQPKPAKRGRRKAAAKPTNAAPEEVASETAALERLEGALHQLGELSSADAQSATGLSAAEVRPHLKKLVELGLAEKTGAGRGTRYVKAAR